MSTGYVYNTIHLYTCTNYNRFFKKCNKKFLDFLRIPRESLRVLRGGRMEKIEKDLVTSRLRYSNNQRAWKARSRNWFAGVFARFRKKTLRTSFIARNLLGSRAKLAKFLLRTYVRDPVRFSASTQNVCRTGRLRRAKTPANQQV